FCAKPTSNSLFFLSSRRRHTRSKRDWSSDVCSSDLVLGLMTVYTNPEAATQDVPTLFMVQNGVGASFMTPLISILIILGAVSTAVNMVAAMVKRICREQPVRPDGRFSVSKKEMAAALICCMADFGIA